MMTPPIESCIAAAREQAKRSPCAKSKRGAVVFDPRTGRILGRGFNHQPAPFACDGSDACKAACGQLCIHAEDAAIRAMDDYWRDYTRVLEVVHVKVVNGHVRPGKGPCCVQCSKLVLDVGLKGVWLFEGNCCAWWKCDRLATVSIVATHERAGELTTAYRCDEHRDELAESWKRIRQSAHAPEWRFYAAADFHRETLRACGLHAPEQPSCYPCGCSRIKVDLGRCDVYKPGELP